MRTRLVVAAVVLAGAALLSSYVAVVRSLGPDQRRTADLSAPYAAAVLLRTGDRGAMYDRAVERRLHLAMGAPVDNADIPFANPPVAAAIALPLTVVPLEDAVVAMVVASAVALLAAVGMLSAGGRATWGRLGFAGPVLAVALVAGATSTGAVFLEAQWDALLAFGLAAGVLLWRRGHGTAGSVAAVLPLLCIKPHLAVGLIAFTVGWRATGVLRGVVVAAVLAAVASALVAGPALTSYVASLSDASSITNPAQMLGGTGLWVSLLGDGRVAALLGDATCAAAVMGCLGIGVLLRRGRVSWEVAVGGVSAGTLLAAPHLLDHDLVLLVPALVVLLAAAARADGAVAADPRTLAVILGWAVVQWALWIDATGGSAVFPGRLTPWLLAGCLGASIARGVLPPLGAPAAPGRRVPVEAR